MAEDLLSPQLLRQLEQFQLLARRRSRSASKGERRSRARGQSVEFADYRDYTPGDDFRYLDWNLYGRLDRLFLKLYEEERELPVRILMDASESMSFGEPTKFDFARKIAAAIGYVALCGFDRVSVVPFPNAPDQAAMYGALRSVRGRRSALELFKNLHGLRPGGTVVLNDALRRASVEAKQTGLVIVLSDFLDPAGYEEGFKSLLARGFQVDVVHILSPEELEPATYGDLKLVDAETGSVREVTFGKFRLKAYRQLAEAFCQRLRDFCRTRGMSYFLTRSNASLEDLLLKRLRELEVWR